ncbi:kinetochore-associated Ndc80 complex subunit NUF2 KNAG_0K01060 [Huiozyma naganishii CBS 8797]|uniref:Kinetochore protein Nuf2 N-terminal domain-containing protein n=1 Tax=Huiozyma naganishii (strain ATCC MYA-139 / BCRC 22969 / CBS 8797 / KCTC 17520 / NBRC 10181 / NCYC 3082 / Yp74L-3) TaxID=1071383 RepID=J7SAU6_HUIN7|nr:hypothetical protein KNAG_0K01060 [Kazachstania naganishii CBS 8797]CCK72471.1 hypothetical protein KNAG_0K01060 [Kazachstania naganishii CBS 8797]
MIQEDEFPLLGVEEIASCLQECDFNGATVDTIRKPSVDTIIPLYEEIVDLYLNITVDHYLPAGSEINDEVGMRMCTLNAICDRFFKNIGVSDFNMLDLCRPDFERTRRLLSAVVNYARFRDERIFDCTDLIHKMSDLSDIFVTRFNEFNLLRKQNTEIEAELGDLDNINEETSNDLSRLEAESNEMIEKLKDLEQTKSALLVQQDAYKLEKRTLLTQLESLSFQIVELESKRDKFAEMSTTDMQDLTNSINNLSRILTERQADLTDLKSKQTNLESTFQTMKRVIDEICALLKILTTVLQPTFNKEIATFETRQKVNNTVARLDTFMNESVLSKRNALQAKIVERETNGDIVEKELRQRIKVDQEVIDQLEETYVNDICTRDRATEEDIQKNIIEGIVNATEEQIRRAKDEHQREIDLVNQKYEELVTQVEVYVKMLTSRLK